MSNKNTFKKLYSKKFNKKENYNKIIDSIERDNIKFKSKKLILVPICLTVIVFVAIINFNNKSIDKLLNNQLPDNTDKENNYVPLINATASIDVMFPKSLYEDAKYVAIVKIESIDGADTYNPVLDMYVLPYTYGKMKILKVIKGDIKEGSIVNFNRLGGRVTLEQWYNSMSKSEQEAFDKYNPTTVFEIPYKKVDYRFESDISVKSGKIYLVYFSEYSVRSEEEIEYGMRYFEYGLREVKNQKITDYSNIDLDKIEVLDNHSGKYERVSEVIEKY